jgi:hypothetical protein
MRINLEGAFLRLLDSCEIDVFVCLRTAIYYQVLRRCFYACFQEDEEFPMTQVTN